MANRGVDQSEMRTSINQVAPQEGISSGTPLVETLSQIGQQIIKQGQEAKINENFSNAQVAVNNLDRQFQVDYAHDPFNKEGLAKLKEDRDAVFAKNAEGISPFFKRPYDEATRKLGQTSAAATEAFGYVQTKKNTVTSINNALKNNLSQASIDGENGVPLGNAMLNFHTSKEALMRSADGILSKPEADTLLENFNQDYLKMYMSGKAYTNPIDALKMMDSKEVRDSFRDPEEYTKMRDAIENKALTIQKVNIEKDVINNLKTEIDTFKEGKPLTYAQVQDVTRNMSEPARQYFIKSSGYSKEERTPKLTDAQKVNIKADLVNSIAKFTQSEDMNTDDAGQFQTQIFDAMNKDAISPKEGMSLIDQLVAPVLKGKEDRISNFTVGSWVPFTDKAGFPAIEKFYENNVRIKSQAEKDATFGDTFVSEEEKKASTGQVGDTLNNVNKANLYDAYFNVLTEKAAAMGTTVAGLSDLDRSKRTKIYKDAADMAINDFKANSSPLLLHGAIPQVAISRLIKEPELAHLFDEQFGVGAANRILGK